MIEHLVEEMGKRWAEIARRLGNRSDNAVKNWWNGSMNRRKRHSPSSSSVKHVGSRPQPVTTMKLQRSQYSLPQGVIAHRNNLHYDQAGTQNRWSTPASSFASHHNVEPAIGCLQSSSESNLLLPSQIQTNLPPLQQSRLPRPGGSCPGVRDDFNAHQLPPLRLLPPLSNHQPHSGQGNDNPSVSPTVSDFSQALPPPSLISDSQSSYSVSPKAVVSPRLNERLLPDTGVCYGQQHHQMRVEDASRRQSVITLSPLVLNTPALPARLSGNHAQQFSYSRKGYLDKGSCAAGWEKDTRMQLSSLVQ